MLLLSYLYNISERQVEDLCNLYLPAKCFLGLGVDERPPDHSTLSAFKKRILENGKVAAFENLLQTVISLALEKGIDIAAIDPTGPDGVILLRDVEAAAAAPAGDSTSVVTLSASTIKMLSPRSTESPSVFSHSTILPFSTVTPSMGITTSVAIVGYSFIKRIPSKTESPAPGTFHPE
jgi:hypothetical protein